MKWDALLARHIAVELSRALVGAKLRALRLDGVTRDLTLLLEERTLLWALHPRRGWPRVLGPAEPVEGDFKLRGQVLGIDAPPDERVVRLLLSSADDRSLRLIVELMGNQWNALLVEGEPGVIRHVLWRRDGARPQRVGEPYLPPRPLSRAGLAGDVTADVWTDTLARLPRSERAGALVRAFAWTSPLNASALLDAEPAAGGLQVGYGRWKRMVDASSASDPVLLELPAGPQPYPFPLPGTPSRPVESLLRGFEVCAAEDPQPSAAASPGLDPTLLGGLEGALRRASGRVARIESELEGLEDPAEQRALGDLILARYADIPKGAARAQLTGFDGATVEVELDPAEPPQANAARYYTTATKAARAAERLPVLLEQARAAQDRAADLLARARDGSADEAEVRATLGGDGTPRVDVPREARPTLPYRVFRSSGGLEIRVGRGARHNDDLTFHHSSPEDVWLHARHVGGAHVILRWPGPGNPPARDLAEAAALAAAHSKARTSASVPVDWTFRKYVRKPRKSPPGRVAADRLETVFVTPDPRLVQSLAGE